MIITLVKADFSTKNIGTLGSFSILTDLSAGLEYSGPTFITQRQSLEAVISTKKKYVLMPAAAKTDADTSANFLELFLLS